MLYQKTKPVMAPIIVPEVTLRDYDKCTIIKEALGFLLGNYKPVNNKPFGFVDSPRATDVFAYGLGNQPMQILFTAKMGPKGLKVDQWRKPTPEDLQIIEAAVEAARDRDQKAREQLHREIAERDYNEALLLWEKEKAFCENYGFYAINVVKRSKNNYGCAHWENYTFSREITDREFMAYLKAIGANLTPETVDAPVCQGSISLYRDGYSWATSGTSVNWTRYEKEVYYD